MTALLSATNLNRHQNDPDDIAGVVTSSKGPEGKKVIAETTDLPTRSSRLLLRTIADGICCPTL
jgi:hypothetical protein